MSTNLPFIEFSNSTIHNQTTTTTIPVWIRILTLTSMIMIDISAFFGNLLVICAFMRTRRLQTVTNYFIASLALADALVAIFVLPLSIYYYQRDYSWKLGLILCDLWVSSDVLLCTSSILNLTCISVDRYMAITKPLTYTAYRSKFLARIMILLVWAVSAVITCPPIFGWRDKNRSYNVERNHQCDLNTARGYVVYSALGSFYIPGVVMIFVYIRIFMVVYDRENLIKKFQINHNSSQSTNISIKSNKLDLIQHSNINNRSNLKRICSCCCLSFRKSSNDEFNSKSPTTQYSCNNTGPTIEQNQNGYLIYRFTNTTNVNNNNNNNILSSTKNSNSPVHTPPANAKTMISCHLFQNSIKKSTASPDQIYQNNKRNYAGQITPEYKFHNDNMPCYELTTIDQSSSPTMKCRSRSFEHTTTTSKIRDLNTELNHSRQLKAAAAAAAAAAITTINSAYIIDRKSDFEDSILSNKKHDQDDLYSSIDENLHKITRSLNELSRISVVSSKRNASQQLNVTSNNVQQIKSSFIEKKFSNSSTYPYLIQQKQSLPEPTRINRRIKSSRTIKTSPSTIFIDEYKQQHRITRNSSLKSTHSSKSLASIFRSTNLNETNSNKTSTCWYSYCCCCSQSSINQNQIKQIYNYTPNNSLTNEDDYDDEKLSSNDTSNRTPLYTPIHTSNLQRTSTTTNAAPTDVNRRERIRFMKEQKTAKTLAVVVGGFIILWLPFFIMYIIPPEKHLLNKYTVTLITWLGYFNSVINPFIYAYCSKQFRMAFWNITFGICIKKSSALLPIAAKNKQIHQRHVNA